MTEYLRGHPVCLFYKGTTTRAKIYGKSAMGEGFYLINEREDGGGSVITTEFKAGTEQNSYFISGNCIKAKAAGLSYKSLFSPIVMIAIGFIIYLIVKK